jgi:hypothetical protein
MRRKQGTQHCSERILEDQQLQTQKQLELEFT